MATATEGGHAEALALAFLDQGAHLGEFHDRPETLFTKDFVIRKDYDWSQHPRVAVEAPPGSVGNSWSSVSSLSILFNPEDSSEVLVMSDAFGYAAVPEPVTMACVLAGVGSLGLYVRKRLRR
jgi:hypothetical protein